MLYPSAATRAMIRIEQALRGFLIQSHQACYHIWFILAESCIQCMLSIESRISPNFTLTLWVPLVTNINFLLKIFIHSQGIRLGELMKWSLKRKCFDLLSNSLNTFFKETYGDQFGEFCTCLCLQIKHIPHPINLLGTLTTLPGGWILHTW